MVKYARDLEPGDVIFINGNRVQVEMVSNYGGACTIQHSRGVKYCDHCARFLVEETSAYVVEAEKIIRK